MNPSNYVYAVFIRSCYVMLYAVHSRYATSLMLQFAVVRQEAGESVMTSPLIETVVQNREEHQLKLRIRIFYQFLYPRFTRTQHTTNVLNERRVLIMSEHYQFIIVTFSNSSTSAL